MSPFKSKWQDSAGISYSQETYDRIDKILAEPKMTGPHNSVNFVSEFGDGYYLLTRECGIERFHTWTIVDVNLNFVRQLCYFLGSKDTFPPPRRGYVDAQYTEFSDHLMSLGTESVLLSADYREAYAKEPLYDFYSPAEIRSISKIVLTGDYLHQLGISRWHPIANFNAVMDHFLSLANGHSFLSGKWEPDPNRCKGASIGRRST